MRLNIQRTIASLLLLSSISLAERALAQVTLWNNNGTDFGNAANWTAGVPNSTTNAQFSPQTGVTGSVQNPTLSASHSALSLLLANNYRGGGYTFNRTGFGNLTVGGTGSLGIVTRGSATYTFNGPLIQGFGSSSNEVANLNIGSSTSLVLTGATTANVNIGNLTFRGNGTLVVDNSTNDLGARFILSTDREIGFNGGGTLVLQGDADGSNFGSVTTGTVSLGGRVRLGAGDATIKIVQPAGATGGSTVTFSRLDRQTASGVINFVAEGGGTLGGGGAADPSIFFNTAPFLTNGVISTANGGAGTGYAIVNGTDFASYGANGVVAVASTNVSGALTTSPTTNANLTGNATIAASTLVAYNTLKISPTTLTGQSLTLGAGAILSTVGILYNGASGGEFTISGGTLTGNAVRTFYVNNANSALLTSMNLAGSLQPVVKSGAGFMVLTGTTDQLNFGGSIQFVSLSDGTLRARISGPDLNLGLNNNIRFRGGVLEVESTGGGSTFSRNLGTGLNPNEVNWSAGPGPVANTGGGGFSAIGGPLTVNLGGAGATLTWAGQTGTNINFVQDGYALKFGSTRSDAAVIWQNPINLDGGTGNYAVREIQVIGNNASTGDLVRFTGAIGGGSTTDLLKTGTGTMELAANNTYAGNTLVKEGVLQVNSGASIGGGTLGAPTTSGTVYVYSGATLAGEGEIRSSATQGAAYVDGGAIAPGTGLSGDIGTLSLTSLTLTNGAVMQFELDNTAGLGTSAAADRVALSTFFNKGMGTDPLVFDFLFTGANNNTYTLATFTSSNYSVSDFTATNLPGGVNGVFVLNSNELLYVTNVIVPEPGSFALMGMGIFGAGWYRRRSLKRKA